MKTPSVRVIKFVKKPDRFNDFSIKMVDNVREKLKFYSILHLIRLFCKKIRRFNDFSTKYVCESIY